MPLYGHRAPGLPIDMGRGRSSSLGLSGWLVIGPGCHKAIMFWAGCPQRLSVGVDAGKHPSYTGYIERCRLNPLSDNCGEGQPLLPEPGFKAFCGMPQFAWRLGFGSVVRVQTMVVRSHTKWLGFRGIAACCYGEPSRRSRRFLWLGPRIV